METRDNSIERVATGQTTEVFCPDQLLQRCLGNLDFAQRVLDCFLSVIDGELSELENACQSLDQAGVARVAHRLKGSAAGIAAPRLQQVAAHLEVAGNEKSQEDIDSLLPRLLAESSTLKQLVSDWTRGEEPVPTTRTGKALPIREA